MVGITLSPEQIHQAPPEVRRWIEQEISRAIGFAPRAAPELPALRLATVGADEARAILRQIQNLLPVVSVFFELGREAVAANEQRVRVLRLPDIMSHALLHTPAQAVECIEAINRVAAAIRGEPGVALCALDRNGHCFVADETARSILEVWREIVAARALAGQGGRDEAPAEAVHLAAPTQTQPLSYAAAWPAGPAARIAF